MSQNDDFASSASAMNFKFIKRGRGRVLLYAGHQYYRNTTYVKKKNTYWRCKSYKSIKCKGLIVLSDNEEIIESIGGHSNSCTADETQNDIDIIVNNYVEKAAQGKEPAPRVYRQCLLELTDKGLHMASSKPIPTFTQKKSSIYRKIHALAQVDKIRTSVLSEVQIPCKFQENILADFYDGEMKMIIYCSKKSQIVMKTVKQCFMDGTFKSSPTPFCQLYTIHGDMGSDIETINVKPLVYIFMSHKSEKAYTIMFQLIKSQISEWEPEVVHLDYEMAVIKTLSKMFDNIKIKGCYFHFRNCLSRKNKKLCLKAKHHKYFVNLCSVLALLPINDVNRGWQYVSTEILSASDAKLNKFRVYFQKFWMRSNFIETWNIFSEQHRTNNIVEGWNFKINSLINKHPTMLLILHVLNDDDNLAHFRVQQFNKFGKKPFKKRSNIDVERDTFIENYKLQLVCKQISVEIYLYKIALYTAS